MSDLVDLSSLTPLKALTDAASEARCHFICAMKTADVSSVDYHAERAEVILATLSKLTLDALASYSQIREAVLSHRDSLSSTSRIADD